MWFGRLPLVLRPLLLFLWLVHEFCGVVLFAVVVGTGLIVLVVVVVVVVVSGTEEEFAVVCRRRLEGAYGL